MACDNGMPLFVAKHVTASVGVDLNVMPKSKPPRAGVSDSTAAPAGNIYLQPCDNADEKVTRNTFIETARNIMRYIYRACLCKVRSPRSCWEGDYF